MIDIVVFHMVRYFESKKYAQTSDLQVHIIVGDIGRMFQRVELFAGIGEGQDKLVRQFHREFHHAVLVFIGIGADIDKNFLGGKTKHLFQRFRDTVIVRDELVEERQAFQPGGHGACESSGGAGGHWGWRCMIHRILNFLLPDGFRMSLFVKRRPMPGFLWFILA